MIMPERESEVWSFREVENSNSSLNFQPFYTTLCDADGLEYFSRMLSPRARWLDWLLFTRKNYHFLLLALPCVARAAALVTVDFRLSLQHLISFFLSLLFFFGRVSGITSNKASQKVLILFLPFHVSCFMRRIWFL